MGAENRMDASGALSDYLRAAAGLGVDELLLRGCLDGRLPGRLGEFAKVDAARVGSYTQGDGPELWSYEGKLTVQGVVFRFECVIFYEPTREVYAVEVLELAPVEWTARMAVA